MAPQARPKLLANGAGADGTHYGKIFGGGEHVELIGGMRQVPFPTESVVMCGLWLVPVAVYFLFDRVVRQRRRVVELKRAVDDTEENENDCWSPQVVSSTASASKKSDGQEASPMSLRDIRLVNLDGDDCTKQLSIRIRQRSLSKDDMVAQDLLGPTSFGNPEGDSPAAFTQDVHQGKLSKKEAAAILQERLVVLYSSLEFKIPGVPGAKANAGGLGKVTDLIARHHPGSIIMVHPMVDAVGGVDYTGVEGEDQPLILRVDGVEEVVKVYRHVEYPQGKDGPSAVFLLLSHKHFEARTKTDIYPNPMTRRQVLHFWALWNKAVGALLVRHKPHVFHCPDFHTAVAPWYAFPEHPSLKMMLVLHNVEYQGQISTNMIMGERLKTMAALWDLPGDSVNMCKKHLTYKGRFNMLKSAVNFIADNQRGVGVCAVSRNYAFECHHSYSVLWRLKSVAALDNPMLEEERPTVAAGKKLQQMKADAKEKVQKEFGLKENPDAKIFTFLGRLVRQKGVDFMADEALWLLDTFPQAQLIFIGPVGDGFGHYAKIKLELLAKEERFRGRLFVKCEFLMVGAALKYATDFCLMPSRDEPFGYVDIEFAWHGALVVGAQAGGLGKVPGFYFVAQNRDNIARLRKELRIVCTEAIQCPDDQLERMSAQGIQTDFPLSQWKGRLLNLYNGLVPAESLQKKGADPLCEIARTSNTPIFKPKEGRVRGLTEHNPLTKRQGQGEFLTQEPSEEEMTLRVQALLDEFPELNTQQIQERIGTQRNQELEETSHFLTRFLLKQLCGMHIVDILVCFGYVTASMVDTLSVVMATEWANRIDVDPMVASSDHYLPMVLFSWHSAGYAMGAPIWAILCMYLPPRVVMGTNMAMRCVFLLTIFPINPSVTAAIYLSIANGFVSAGGILFVVFNFMLSIRADFTQIAIRLGALEMGRYCIQWFVMAFVFIANPTAIGGNRDNAITWELSRAMLPLVIFSVLTIPIPAVLLFFAPGPYREDRLPDWDFMVVFKKPSFILMAISDLLGGIISYPALTFITWWLLQGWFVEDLIWISIVTGLACAVGMGLFAGALGHSPQSGIIVLIAICLLLAPPIILRAFVQSQVSTDTYLGRSHAALGISITSLVLEAVRNSAMWTAKLKMLKDRWRFLSYATVLLTLTHICSAVSPWICEKITWDYTLGSFGAPNQRRLAMAVEYSTIFPGGFALAQFFFQFSAAHFITRDLEVAKGAMRKEELGIWWRRFKTIKTTIVWLMGVATLVCFASISYAGHKSTHELPFNYPVWPCRLDGVPDCQVLKNFTNADPAVYGTGTFGKNRFDMATTARANCFREMYDLGADTFILYPEVGTCSILRCEGEPRTVVNATQATSPLEVYSQHCSFKKTRFVAVQLFEWRWDDIAKECEQFLGPSGFESVHISPPTEHIRGTGWASRYQPVSYNLDSRSGTPQEFVDMVKRCHNVGVAIMVDAVINHMASTLKEGWTIKSDGNECRNLPGGCVGTNGTKYASREFRDNHEDVDYFMPPDFHHKIGNKGTNCGWPPWANDRYNCDMRSLPDLNTEAQKVQLMILRYLFGLYEIGVTHVRIDAAGSIYSASLNQIIHGVPWDYVLQEYYPGDILGQMSCLENGHVTDMEWGLQMAAMGAIYDTYSHGRYEDTTDNFDNLLKMGLMTVQGEKGPFWDGSHVAREEQGMIFMANHDSERERWQGNASEVDGYYCSYPYGGERANKCTPIYKHGKQYNLAQLFMLAWPYGRTLRVLSSFAFTEFKGGPPLVPSEDPDAARSLSVGHGARATDHPRKCKLTPERSPASLAYDEDPSRPWICQHRWNGMAGMIRFRTLIKEFNHYQVWKVFHDREGHLAYSIHNVAFVAASRGYNDFTGHGSNATFNLSGVATGMPNGTYCNLALENYPVPTPDKWHLFETPASCAANQTVVIAANGDIITGFLGGGDVLAIHVNYTDLIATPVLT